MLNPEPFVRGLVIDDRPWCQYVASFLSSAVPPDWRTGSNTEKAETGLRIKPSVYWYIRHVHYAFNRMVMFHQIIHGKLSSNDRGVCRFDSGALWSGNTIRTGWTEEQKRAYFDTHDRPIGAGLKEFVLYVEANFDGDCERYQKGEKPTCAIPEIVDAVAPEAPWAPWLWELRIEKPRVMDLTRIMGIVWTRDSEQEFSNWLERSALDSLTAQDLQAAASRLGVLCNDRESVYDRARRLISEKWG